MNADLIPNLTVKVPLRPWHDYRAWTAEIDASRHQDTLHRWCAAAGGFIEGGTATLPALPAGPARRSLANTLLSQGIAARVGSMPAMIDFGAEMRAAGIKPEAHLVITFELESVGKGVVRGRVHEGGTFAITVITNQTETEVLTHHRRGRGLRVEGVMCPQAFRRRDAAVIPIVGLVSGAAR